MWTKHTDPASGDPFYVNGETNATAWDPPAGWVDPDEVGAAAQAGGGGDAEEWEQHTDPGSGDSYWFHKTLGKVRAGTPLLLCRSCFHPPSRIASLSHAPGPHLTPSTSRITPLLVVA